MICNINTQLLLLYKKLSIKYPRKAIRVFEGIPAIIDDDFLDDIFDFFFTDFLFILELITPSKMVYDEKCDNMFTDEKGVDKLVITHPFILRVDRIYTYLECNYPNSKLFNMFGKLYSKAYDYMDNIAMCGDGIEIIDGKSYKKEVNKVLLYFHQPPYYFHVFNVLYFFYMFIEALNEAILYAKEALGDNEFVKAISAPKQNNIP